MRRPYSGVHSPSDRARRGAMSGASRSRFWLHEDSIMATAVTPYRRGVNLFDSFRNEMEGLFERFFGEEGGNGQAVKAWAPRVDVEETEKEILVKADLPGVDPKDVEVQVEENVLTIRGEKKEQKEEKKKNFHRLERFVGTFYRAIPLPTGADADKVSATSANGTVTVTVPKKPGTQPKKITVQAKS
jgi:HSP20 family protein